MSANELVHQAVELAVERNPRLVVEPYYQMKAAATILAERLIAVAWINVSDRLPRGEGQVRIKLRDNSELEGAIWQSDGDWWWDNKFFVEDRVTHWRPSSPEASL